MAQHLDLTIFTNTRRTRVDVDRRLDDGTFSQRSTTAPTLAQVLEQIHPDDRAHLIAFAVAVLDQAGPTAGLWRPCQNTIPALVDEPQQPPADLAEAIDAMRAEAQFTGRSTGREY